MRCIEPGGRVQGLSAREVGRQNIAHGVSRGLARLTLTPVPSPARRERGAEGGVRAMEPRVCALGYSMPPLTGLKYGDLKSLIY